MIIGDREEIEEEEAEVAAEWGEGSPSELKRTTAMMMVVQTWHRVVRSVWKDPRRRRRGSLRSCPLTFTDPLSSNTRHSDKVVRPERFSLCFISPRLYYSERIRVSVWKYANLIRINCNESAANIFVHLKEQCRFLRNNTILWNARQMDIS